jgi:hypothetical protein
MLTNGLCAQSQASPGRGAAAAASDRGRAEEKSPESRRLMAAFADARGWN